MKGIVVVYLGRIINAVLLLAWLLLPTLAAAQVPPVELATVERRNIIETLRLSGSLTSPKTARLSPDVEGRLVRLNVDDAPAPDVDGIGSADDAGTDRGE